MNRLASGASPFSTFFQVAPRLIEVAGHMRPTWHLPSLAALHPAFLQEHGIQGLIWDVDGTLTGDRRPALEPEAREPFCTLIAAPDLRHVILSNASEERFTELGTVFPEIPILRGYLLGEERLFRRLQGEQDSWSPQELTDRLAAGARMIRKPSADLVAYAVESLGLDRAAVAMVGDQYLTDVAGANLGGIRSIKVPTLAGHTFRPSVKLSHRLEAMLYRLRHGREETVPS